MPLVLLIATLILLMSSGCGGPGEPIGLKLQKASRALLEEGCDQPIASDAGQKLTSKLSPKYENRVPRFNFQLVASSATQKLSKKQLLLGQELNFALDKSCNPEDRKTAVSILRGWGKVRFRTAKVFDYGSLKLKVDILVSDIKESLSENSCLRTIELKKSFNKVNLPSDPGFPEQVYLDRIGFHKSFGRYKEPLGELSEKVLVAVIDSGVDLDHPDLEGQVWRNPDEIPDNGLDDDSNGYVDDVSGYNFADDLPSPESPESEDDVHGTAVAGLIAATENDQGVVGVAPVGIQIMSLNVFSANETVSAEQIALAIDYAASRGAKVINLSLAGAGDSSVLRLAIEQALSSGATLVAAAGNFGAEVDSNQIYTPGSYGPEYSGLINVGSVNSQDLSFSLFSNFSHERVEISAPGAFQYSLVLTQGLLVLSNDGGYSRLQGTSFAAPLVAGAAAVAIGVSRSQGRDLSPSEVESLVVGSGIQYRGLSGKVRDCRFMSLEKLIMGLM